MTDRSQCDFRYVIMPYYHPGRQICYAVYLWHCVSLIFSLFVTNTINRISYFDNSFESHLLICFAVVSMNVDTSVLLPVISNTFVFVSFIPSFVYNFTKFLSFLGNDETNMRRIANSVSQKVVFDSYQTLVTIETTRLPMQAIVLCTFLIISVVFLGTRTHTFIFVSLVQQV